MDGLNADGQAARRIPYRDSKLTRLLQDSLGGRSVALMIANVAPTEAFLSDTCNTLNFASKSRMIVNRVVINDDPKVCNNLKKNAVVDLKERIIVRKRPAVIISSPVAKEDLDNPFVDQQKLKHHRRQEHLPTPESIEAK